MGVAPDLGAEVYSGEDGGGVDPHVVEDVSAEWGDERKGMSVEVWDAGDIAKEVALDELLLGNPEFLSAVVDNRVLMGVAVDGESAGRGGEKIRKNFC